MLDLCLTHPRGPHSRAFKLRHFNNHAPLGIVRADKVFDTVHPGNLVTTCRVPQKTWWTRKSASLWRFKKTDILMIQTIVTITPWCRQGANNNSVFNRCPTLPPTVWENIDLIPPVNHLS